MISTFLSKPRLNISFSKSPVMIVFPAPVSSASKNRMVEEMVVVEEMGEVVEGEMEEVVEEGDGGIMMLNIYTKYHGDTTITCEVTARTRYK